MSYINQPDNTSCGPTAIYNSLIWCGLSLSIDDFAYIRSLCKQVPKYGGTRSSNLYAALSRCSLYEVSIDGSPTVDKILKDLKKGRGIILQFIKKSGRSGHYTFLYKTSAINHTQNNLRLKVNERLLRTALKQKKWGAPKVFILKKL